MFALLLLLWISILTCICCDSSHSNIRRSLIAGYFSLQEFRELTEKELSRVLFSYGVGNIRRIVDDKKEISQIRANIKLGNAFSIGAFKCDSFETLPTSANIVTCSNGQTEMEIQIRKPYTFAELEKAGGADKYAVSDEFVSRAGINAMDNAFEAGEEQFKLPGLEYTCQIFDVADTKVNYILDYEIFDEWILKNDPTKFDIGLCHDSEKSVKVITGYKAAKRRRTLFY